MFKNKVSVFDNIDKFLRKKGHELYMSIYLHGYNGNNIYIRFDYVPKLSVYKIVWIDLNFFDEKHIEDYINMQIVTKFLAMKIVEHLSREEVENKYSYDDDIVGDRVEILTYFKNAHEYIFDRFLPLEWKFLIDPLALIFSYLPRGMEVFLNEMFAKFDHLEDTYNYLKPVKLDLLNGDLKKVFKPSEIEKGKKYYENGSVSFLEKIENRYIAIVDEKYPYLIIITELENEYVRVWCNCKFNTFCKHIYAVIMAIREKKFNNFYKVKYTGKEESLLEKLALGSFYLCFGVENGKLLLITTDGVIFPADIIQKNKCVFEVIEDDDECSLSNYIEDLKIK